jgi:hypothetical protein
VGGATSEGGPAAVCTCVDRGVAYVNTTTYNAASGCACAAGYAKFNAEPGGECSGDGGWADTSANVAGSSVCVSACARFSN